MQLSPGSPQAILSYPGVVGPSSVPCRRSRAGRDPREPQRNVGEARFGGEVWAALRGCVRGWRDLVWSPNNSSVGSYALAWDVRLLRDRHSRSGEPLQDGFVASVELGAGAGIHCGGPTGEVCMFRAHHLGVKLDHGIDRLQI